LQRIKANCSKASGERLTFEIDGSEGQRLRRRDGSGIKLLALPDLRRWVIHLKNAEPIPEGTTIGVRVQARPEYDKLTDSSSYRRCQCILGKSSSDGDEQPHSRSCRMLLCLAGNRLGVLTHDAQSQRVVENAPLLEDLMSGAVGGRCERSPAWLAHLHGGSVAKRACGCGESFNMCCCSHSTSGRRRSLCSVT